MDKIEAKEAVKELTLVLMYLLRFTDEKDFYNAKYFSAWKGYDFDVINEFVDKEYIYDGKRPSRTKSISFSQEGIEEAKRLLEKYHIEDWHK